MTCSDHARATEDTAPAGADGARELAYRRSLRASRGRRIVVELRRRRLTWSKRSALASAAALLIASGGALAATDRGNGGGIVVQISTVVAVQKALGIPADGIVGPQTRAAVKRFQRSKGLVVDGIIGPQTLAALGLRARRVARGKDAIVTEASVNASVLERIATCESGGNPTAVSADGRYRGKYQFSRETWRRMGGSGDPAKASEAEQDRRAAKLLRVAGTSPWPGCV